MTEDQEIYKSCTTNSKIRYSFERIANPQNNNVKQDMVHLRLVCQVGSLLENDDETGAAHFIEHLGFRGTKSFDHGELVKLIESIGSSFGPDLNARTSLCETIWNLDIPLSALQIGLKILNEWAFWIRISEDDVNIERKVILEEWRQKQTAAQRAKRKFWELTAPLVSKRLPIGTIDFISNATSQNLKQFYESCYCSESLQVVCVVEQSDTSHQRINFHDFQKEMEIAFSEENCPRIAKVRHRPFPSSLGDLGNSEQNHIRYACVVDPDLVHSAVSLEILSDYVKVNPSKEFFRRDLIKRIISSLLDERFREKRLSSTTAQNCSVSFGVSVQQPYVELSSIRTELKYKADKEDLHQAIFNLVHEIISIAKIGFSLGELNHAKMKWSKQISHRKRTPAAACDELVEHFSLAEGTPLFGFENEKQMLLALLSESIEQDCIRLDEVNSFCRLWLSDLFAPVEPLIGTDDLADKRVRETMEQDIILVLYQGNSLPDGVNETFLKSAVREALAAPVVNELAKYDISFNEQSLKTCILQCLGQYTESELSQISHEIHELPKSKATLHIFSGNSKTVRICLKHTESSLQVSLQAFALGGATELQHPVDDAAFCMMGDILRESGIAGLSGSHLLKLESLTGTRLFLQRHLHHRGLGGSCPPQEIDLLLAMILERTMQNQMVDQIVLRRLKSREVDSIRASSELSGPAHEEAKALREIAFGNEEPLLNPHTVEDIELIDTERLHTILKQSFGNLDEFTFCLVGSLPSTVVSSIRTFAAGALLGSNPGSEKMRGWRRNANQIRLMNLKFHEGKFKVVHVGQTATDKSQLFIVAKPPDCLSEEIPKCDFALNSTCEAIRSRLLAKLRQSNGEVYSVSAEISRAALSPHARLFVSFSCAIDSDVQLAERVQQELHHIANSGFSIEESSSVLATMKTKAARATSDSHILFQLLDGFKFADPKDISRIDEIASQSFVKQYDNEDGIEHFQDLLQITVKNSLQSGTSCLIIRYSPQKL
jgi:predicted Zn-dependent peptidase